MNEKYKDSRIYSTIYRYDIQNHFTFAWDHMSYLYYTSFSNQEGCDFYKHVNEYIKFNHFIYRNGHYIKYNWL